MTKILHLIDTTGPGGAETVFINLLKGLPTDIYQHVVVLRGEGWLADQVRNIGYEPILVDSKGSFNLHYLFALIQIVRQESIDLIHSHLLGSNVYASVVALVCRLPMVATFHGNVDVASGERFLKSKFRLINFGANAIVCVSRRLQEELRSRSPLASTKVRLIYNGVDPDKFRPEKGDGLKAELGLPADSKVVISIGNIRPAKGYGYLVDAVPSVVARDSRIHFIVVGDPRKDLLAELVAKVAEGGAEANIHFLGFRSDVQDLLCQADVFLLPSISEGFSISTVEAMMAGVPVIATRSGGPEEILDDGETGILIPIADSQAISDAVVGVAQGEVPTGMTTKAREEAEKTFSVNAMLQAYQSLYQELV